MHVCRTILWRSCAPNVEPDHRVKENHMMRVKAAFLNLTPPGPPMTMAVAVHGPKLAPLVRSGFAGPIQTMTDGGM